MTGAMSDTDSTAARVTFFPAMVGKARKPGSVTELREMTTAYARVLNADPPVVGRVDVEHILDEIFAQ